MTDDHSEARERIEGEFLEALSTGDGVIEIGSTVLCDDCSADLTNDPRSGGFLFGSYAYGPCCADRMLGMIDGYGEREYIRGECPEGMRFADWVRSLRGENNRIIVQPGLSPGDLGRWKP